MSPELLQILVCPKTKQPLKYVASEDCLVSAAARLRYRVEAGVPVLLVDEAESISDAEVARLLGA